MSDPNSSRIQQEHWRKKEIITDSDHFAGGREVQQHHQPSYYFPNSTNRLPARAKYRSRADIICAILRVATEGAKKSRIISNAYVSSPQIKDYMNFLLDNDMLKYNSESRKYHTTEKGHRLLRMYDEAKMIFNPR